MYAHFGREEDFDRLTELGVDVDGRIVLARYGELFRANIVSIVYNREQTTTTSHQWRSNSNVVIFPCQSYWASEKLSLRETRKGMLGV